MADAPVVAIRPNYRILGLEWPSDVRPAELSSLVAGGLGWMLDSFDVALYSLVVAYLMRDLGMNKGTAGFLGSLTLISSAVGGILFGFVADRIGRMRSLTFSILIYSFASGACGFAGGVVALGAFRLILGLGMGGEWTAATSLVAETWRAEHRGKAIGVMQSMWAVGQIAAAGVAGLVLPRFGWRGVFFVGVLPALSIFWMQRHVPEPEIWRERAATRNDSVGKTLRLFWRPDIRRNALIATVMNTFGMFGYWGMFFWIPAYLSMSGSQGGRGLDIAKTTAWLVVMGIGQWFGYALFGFAADHWGRKRVYVFYLVIAALLAPLYGYIHRPLFLLLLGPFVAFFGSGFFSGFGMIASELFPTDIRATALGICFNVGRGISAVAPFAIGLLAAEMGLGHSFIFVGIAFFASAMVVFALPETKGKQLD